MRGLEQSEKISAPLAGALDFLEPEFRFEERALVAAKCAGLLTGYDAQWRNAPYRIDEVESVMMGDLVNIATGRKSRSFTLAGKLDVRATDIHTGAKILLDHKTTSEDIADPNAAFWRILAIEGQASLYMLLEWLHGQKVDYALWDAVRKPSIAPRSLPKAELIRALAERTYCGAEITVDDLDILNETSRETPRMYAARLASDCTEIRPDWYFQRRKVARLDSEIAEFAAEMWDHGQEILAARQCRRWPRNSGACFTYNTPCEYLGICSGHDTAASPGWTERPWVHPELPILTSGRGVDVLTNSRVKTFQTCRRKHHLRYELGVVRTDREEREALIMGDLFHRALEAYFLQLKAEQQRGQS